MEKIFPGVFRSGNRLLTRNLVPGFRSHSEELVSEGGREYRVWSPSHSKPAAAIAKGLKTFPVKPGSRILYLGVANGNTACFFSDIVGPEGLVYGVEISARSIRDLNPLAMKRKNIIPVLANARLPEKYSWIEKVDVVYQDVASSDQSEILVRNCGRFLRKGGYAILAIKSRSIDVTKKPGIVYREELEKLKRHFAILEKKKLDPFEKDHLFVVMKAV
jgi:fibrillarin-like pre-rRNA processing protein